MKRLLLLVSIVLILTGCTDFEYSPHQAFDPDSPTDLNAKNLEKLLKITNDDTVRFIVSGDSQRSYNEVELFIKKANTIPGIDMVFIAGDLTEFGILQEMEWVVDQFSKLSVPFFAVIGNHDLLAKGSVAFQRMFGNLNYSFTYDGVKFICHDTNGREYKFNGKVPDINWVQGQMSASADVMHYIGVSHMRPFSDDFDSKLDTAYTNILNSNPAFLASFHGHDHSFGEYFPNNSRVPFVVTTTLGKKGFLLVEIVDDQIKYERVTY